MPKITVSPQESQSILHESIKEIFYGNSRTACGNSERVLAILASDISEQPIDEVKAKIRLFHALAKAGTLGLTSLMQSKIEHVLGCYFKNLCASRGITFSNTIEFNSSEARGK